MGCRCTDISKLNNEITSLNYALSQINYAAQSSKETISKMGEVADDFEGGVIIGNKHHEIADEIREKYNKAVEYINSAKSGVNEALDKAKRELESAKKEDNLYHQSSTTN